MKVIPVLVSGEEIFHLCKVINPKNPLCRQLILHSERINLCKKYDSVFMQFEIVKVGEHLLKYADELKKDLSKYFEVPEELFTFKLIECL